MTCLGPRPRLDVQPAPRAAGRGQGIAALMYRGPVVADFDHRDVEQHRRLLEAAFHDAGWRSRELLDRLSGVDDFYFDSVSRVRLDRWSRGRVALLGDAASCSGRRSAGRRLRELSAV